MNMCPFFQLSSNARDQLAMHDEYLILAQADGIRVDAGEL